MVFLLSSLLLHSPYLLRHLLVRLTLPPDALIVKDGPWEYVKEDMRIDRFRRKERNEDEVMGPGKRRTPLTPDPSRLEVFWQHCGLVVK